ncbi:MAG: EthD family reductase [Acetobacteraceae bacterium]
MIMVTVMYPAGENARFDMDYYMKSHVPMVGQRWNACGLREAKVLRGTGAPGGGAAPYSVMALLTFGSVQEFQRAVEQHGKEVMGDIPNFTNVQPVIQINEVVA